MVMPWVCTGWAILLVAKYPDISDTASALAMPHLRSYTRLSSYRRFAGRRDPGDGVPRVTSPGPDHCERACTTRPSSPGPLPSSAAEPDCGARAGAGLDALRRSGLGVCERSAREARLMRGASATTGTACAGCACGEALTYSCEHRGALTYVHSRWSCIADTTAAKERCCASPSQHKLSGIESSYRREVALNGLQSRVQVPPLAARSPYRRHDRRRAQRHRRRVLIHNGCVTLGRGARPRRPVRVVTQRRAAGPRRKGRRARTLRILCAAL